MASSIFNVKDLFGITAPAGGVIEESSCEQQVELDEIMGEDGEYERVCPKPYGTETARISGRGDMPHATLAAATVTVGNAFVTSRVRREKNDVEPSFEINQKKYFNL